MLLNKKIGLRLFKSNLERLILKKAVIVFFIATILFALFFESRLFLLAGLAIGGIFSIIRLGSLVNVLSGLLIRNNTNNVTMKSIASFLLTQILVAVLLFGSAMINIWLFIGVTAGILLVPTTIMINALTESFGITHNNFE